MKTAFESAADFIIKDMIKSMTCSLEHKPYKSEIAPSFILYHKYKCIKPFTHEHIAQDIHNGRIDSFELDKIYDMRELITNPHNIWYNYKDNFEFIVTWQKWTGRRCHDGYGNSWEEYE